MVARKIRKRNPALDEPLRRDVKELGRILGEVLQEQAGPELFALEERVRALSIRRRRGPTRDRTASDQGLSRLLGQLTLEEAERVVRAFGAYFQLVNVAEQHHVVRRYRAHQADPAPIPGTLEATFQAARERGLAAEKVREALGELQVTLTFTAHPTQAIRRTILEKLDRIFEALEWGELLPHLPKQQQAIRALVKDEVTSIWQTDELRLERPTVEDEVLTLLWYLEEVLYELVGRLPARLSSAFEAVYEEPLALPHGPLRIHAWVGGDMDGNPLVTPVVMEDALWHYRISGLRLLLRDLTALGRRLSASRAHVKIPPSLEKSLAADRKAHPTLDRPRNPAEPWRHKLFIMEARLRATREHAQSDPTTRTKTLPPEAYQRPEELEADLALIVHSLEEAHVAGIVHARALREQVHALGFSIAELELRVPAQELREADAELSGGASTPAGRRILETLRRLGRLQGILGERACRTLILSMAMSALDVRAALRVAKACGAQVDVVPLFETLEALNQSPKILQELFGDRAYRAHLTERGVQEVMIGYSDSGKEVGLFAARAALLRAQTELPGLARAAGVPLRLFHGRGETVARGGGPALQAILALPQGSVAGQYKATEQGEAVDHKYARPPVAQRTVELVLGGALLHTLDLEVRPRGEEEVAFRAAFDLLGELGRQAYRALVEDPQFLPLFEGCTPIEEISQLPIGSRPAKRRAGGLESLRAIPWVFAWTQNRAILPAWYGVGSALEGFGQNAAGRRLLSRMYAKWPWFYAVLDNVEMVLAKADLDIARRYAALAPPSTRKLWAKVEREHALTRAWIKRLSGRRQLLEANPALQRSVALRNPYVDPMSFLQVELLRRKRAGAKDCDRLLLLTLTGIAQGLRNTG